MQEDRIKARAAARIIADMEKTFAPAMQATTLFGSYEAANRVYAAKRRAYEAAMSAHLVELMELTGAIFPVTVEMARELYHEARGRGLDDPEDDVTMDEITAVIRDVAASVEAR